uniref:ADAM metallopeptidase domain 20 n=1 Tax=Oryctolagus cuniculus TaxID=9986 RepID=G1TZR0_RABIT
MAMAEVLVHMKITFLMLCLVVFLFLSGWPQTGHSQHDSHPEVVIPLRITGTDKGIQTPEWLSYRLHIADQRLTIHMKVKKIFITRHFSIFTYTDQGALIKDQPFVPKDCNYHGYVEGDPESLVALSICFGGLQGMLQTNDTLYEIKPKTHSAKFEHLVYKIDSEDTQFSSMRCRLTEEIAQQFQYQELDNSILMQSHYEGWWTHRWYTRLALVVDNARHVYLGSNISNTQNEVIELVNVMNIIYAPLDMVVVLPGIEIWNEQNPIEYAKMPAYLSRFCKWKTDIFNNRIPHDVIHLLVRHGFGSYLGLAFLGAVCDNRYNCAVNSFREKSVIQFVSTIAHELGHNYGMQHDTPGCRCASTKCIMFPSKTSSSKFSNCSYDYYWTTTIKKTCLRELPSKDSYFTRKRCGNGIIEEEEECDCGSLESCTEDPCCSTNCTLVPGAACAFGNCCRDCQLVPSGQVCRKQSNECDLPEWCNGTWHECPEDVHVQDGSPCLGMGYCYEKRCNIRDEQCRQIFGKKAKSANETCYREINTRGDRFGNCGNNSRSYLRCDIDDILCGRIQCENVMEIPPLRNHSNVHITQAHGLNCWGVDYHFGTVTPDIGDVKDGTECGEERVCINRRCVPVPAWDKECLPDMCNMNGICNSKHHCHCGNDFAPPYCQQKGYGGSIDSGPPPERKKEVPKVKKEDNSYFLLSIPLFVLLCCLLLFCCLMNRKSSEKEEQNAQTSPNQPAQKAETTPSQPQKKVPNKK